MRILIAEDDMDLNQIIVKKLTAEGYAVDPCYDGEMALEYLEAAQYDAAVLDIMMPRLDGLEVVKNPAPAWEPDAGTVPDRPRYGGG